MIAGALLLLWAFPQADFFYYRRVTVTDPLADNGVRTESRLFYHESVRLFINGPEYGTARVVPAFEPVLRKFPVASLAPLAASGCRPGFSKKTGSEEKTPTFFGISVLRAIREGSGSASACLRKSRRLGDAGVLPVPTASQPRSDQVEETPDGVKHPSARQLGISTNSRSEPFENAGEVEQTTPFIP